MAIFVDENTKVVVPGPHRLARARSTACATATTAPRSSAGVNPGRPAPDVDGIPVFDTVADAVAATGATASCIFIPAPGVRRPRSSRRPRRHRVHRRASPRASRPRTRRWFFNKLRRDFPDTRLLGPNCPGIISPGKCNIGITAGEIASCRRRRPASASSAARARSPTRRSTS